MADLRRKTVRNFGLAIPARRVTANRLRDAMKRLLNREEYRRRVCALQREIQQAGGLAAAADIIERKFRA